MQLASQLSRAVELNFLRLRDDETYDYVNNKNMKQGPLLSTLVNKLTLLFTRQSVATAATPDALTNHIEDASFDQRANALTTRHFGHQTLWLDFITCPFVNIMPLWEDNYIAVNLDLAFGRVLAPVTECKQVHPNLYYSDISRYDSRISLLSLFSRESLMALVLFWKDRVCKSLG